MTYRLRIFAAGLLLCAAAPLSRAQAPAPGSGSWDTRLSAFNGDVQIYAPGEDKALPVEKGMPLDAGDRIVVGKVGGADISVDGGTLIHLSSLSDFTLSDTNRKQTAFKLTLGTLLAKVQKLLSGQSFVVEAPTAVAAVRGTEFAVSVDPNDPDDSNFGVFDEGKVEVKGQNGGTEMLIGGQETKVSKGQAPLHAYQLSLFKKDRAFMRATMRRRLQSIKATWKAMPPAERQDFRKKSLARLRKLREQLEKKAKEQQQKGDKKQSGDTRESLQKKEKMERLREQIRERQNK